MYFNASGLRSTYRRKRSLGQRRERNKRRQPGEPKIKVHDRLLWNEWVCSGSENLPSLDHLVGEREQSVRNLEAERLRRLDVDGQFKFRGLLNGKIGRLAPFKMRST